MAIIAVFDMPGMTQAQYEEGSSRVNRGRGLPKAGSDWPVPGLVDLGFGDVQPKVFPACNVVTD